MLDYHSSTILQISNDHLLSISPKPTLLIKTPTFPTQYLPCLIILTVISHPESSWHLLPLNHSNLPNVFSLLIFFFFLVPQPGTKPVPPAVEAQSLNHWTARKFLTDFSHYFILPQKRWSTVLLSILNSIDTPWINPWKAQYLIILTSHSSCSYFQGWEN